MILPNAPFEDPRNRQILDTIARLAAGDHSVPLEPTDARDYLDGIIVGLAMLGAELAASSAAAARARDELEQRVLQQTHSQRESEERYRAVVEHSLNPLLVVTASTIVFANPAAAQVLGMPTPGEVAGLSIGDVFAPGFMDLAAARWQRLLTGGSAPPLEMDMLRRDGTTVAVETRGVPIRFGGEPSGLILFRDITAQRLQEQALKAAHDAALAASQAKSMFLANMSHEIRTPMTALVGMAELLAETTLSDEQREYVQTLQRAGDTLLHLIDDILDLSKVEAGQVELEETPFNLAELIEDIIDVLSVRAQSKGIEILVHLAPDIERGRLGDPSRLRQVVTNLVANAIKFTEQGEVGVSIKREPESDRIQFTVWDTGIGVPTNQQSHIFESFSQADVSTTRKYGGTGLGLAISQHLIALMGGTITVESVPGQGSRFSFSLRLPPVAGVLERTAVEPLDLTGKRVLVVDDNATNRMILRETLVGQGARVTDVDGGAAALTEVRKSHQPFDVVLLDGRMPEQDGFAVAERLLAEHPTMMPPILMLTSARGMGDVARARALGLASYLVKPIKRDDLLRAIARAFSTSKEGSSRSSASPSASPLVPLSRGGGGVARALRILLVEDSADNRMLIRAYLKNLPYQVDYATNGEEGVRVFTQQSYDLVLMDMLMPVMDGLQATRAIRLWEQTEGCTATPIVALTANAMASDIAQCMEAGCTAHVGKPVKKAVLLEAIRQHAAQASL